MKRKPLPTTQNETYIISLFKQGRSIERVKSATCNQFDDTVYETLRLAALS